MNPPEHRIPSPSYRFTLLLILAIQGLLATGWIAFDRYQLYQANSSAYALIGLVSALVGGLLILVIGGILMQQMRKASQQLETLSNDYQQAAQQAKGLGYIQQALLLFFSEKDQEKPIRLINEAAALLLPLWRVSIWKFDQEEGQLLNLDYFQIEQNKHESLPPLSAQEHPVLYQELRQTAFVKSSDVTADEAFSEVAPSHPLMTSQSVLALPLAVKGQRYGLIWFSCKKHIKKWTPEELETADMLAVAASLMLREPDQIQLLHALTGHRLFAQQLFEHHPESIARFQLQTHIAADAAEEEKRQSVLELALLTEHNAAFEELFPVAQLSFTFKKVFNLVAQELVDELLRQPNGLLSHFPIQVPAFNGQPRFLLAAIMPVTKDGYIEGFWVAMKETTPYILRDSMMTGLADGLAAPNLLLSEGGQVAFANQAAHHFFAMPPIGENLDWDTLIVDSDQDRFGSALLRLQPQSAHTVVEKVHLRTTQSRTFLADIEMTMFTDVAGKHFTSLVMHEISGRVEAETNLTREKEFYRVLSDLSPEAVLLTDHKGAIQHASQGFLTSFGYEPAGRIGANAFDFIKPADVATLADAFDRVVQDPSLSFQLKIGYLHADQTWRNVRVALRAFTENPADLPSSYLFLIQDLTRFDNDTATPPTADPVNDYFDRAGQGMLLIDEKGQILFANRALSQLMELPVAAIAKNPLFVYLPKQEQPLLRSNLAFLKANPQASFRLMMHLGHAAIGWKSVEIAISAVSATADRPVSFFLQIADLSQRREKESDLAFRARFFSSIFGGLSMGIALINAKGEVQFANSTLQDWFADELPPQLIACFDEKSQQQVRQLLEQTDVPSVEGKVSFVAEFTVQQQTKSVIATLSDATDISTFKGWLLELCEQPEQEAVSEQVATQTA